MQKKSPNKSLQFLVLGRLKNWCGDALYFFGGNLLYMYILLLEPDQTSHTQSMVAKRGLTKRANVHTLV